MSNKKRIDGKYIYFWKADKQNPKTEIWTIHAKDDAVQLGTIKWYGAWRKYSLFIDQRNDDVQLIFEKTCLMDIVNFFDKLMNEYKKRKKEK